MNLNRDALNLIRATEAGRVERTTSGIDRRRTNGIAQRVDKRMRELGDAGLVVCLGPGRPWKVTPEGRAVIGAVS